jgi:protein tyrosine/serine phosphatase
LRWLWLLAAGLVLRGGSVWAAEGAAALGAIPSFHRVDDTLYRGGQPGPGGVSALAALGIRTIVNLRYERDVIDAEAAEAKAAGIEYVSVPMYGLLRPKYDQIARILAILDDPQRRPVFVHCAAGHDRTGVVVACYRVARLKWSAEDAIREALDYGMLKVEYAKRAFVRDYAARLRARLPATPPN